MRYPSGKHYNGLLIFESLAGMEIGICPLAQASAKTLWPSTTCSQMESAAKIVYFQPCLVNKSTWMKYKSASSILLLICDLKEQFMTAKEYYMYCILKLV